MNFWDNRYKSNEYAYGTEPNVYFKEKLNTLNVGKILLPGEGEGRNGVYAATQGWDAIAFDISAEGKKKAELLALKRKVAINYLVGNWNEMIFPKESFDVIALIYTHFQADQKSKFHHYIDSLLKPNGTIIFEGFSKENSEYYKMNPNIGGPKEEGMLYSKNEIISDFKNYKIVELLQDEINLSEGAFHNGTASVIRFVGRKVAYTAPK